MDAVHTIEKKDDLARDHVFPDGILVAQIVLSLIVEELCYL